QLVMYIRSLSEASLQRALLSKSLYQAFEKPRLVLMDFNAASNQEQEELKKRLKEVDRSLQVLNSDADFDEHKFLSLTKERFKLSQNLQKFLERTSLINEGLITLEEEQKQLENTGSLISSAMPSIFQGFLDW